MVQAERLDERARVAVADLPRDDGHRVVRERGERGRAAHPRDEDVLAHGGVADRREHALQLTLRRQRGTGDPGHGQQRVEVALDVRGCGVPNGPVGPGRR